MKIERNGAKSGIDRRVARTRARLQDALIALVPERVYSAITVSDICRAANVAKSTFYTHYSGKDELRSATIGAHLQSLKRARLPAGAERSDRLLEFSLPMLEHAHAFRALHRAPKVGGCETIHDELRQRIRRAVRRELVEKRLVGTDTPVELAVQFVSGAFLSVLTYWIGAGSALSPAQADDVFQRLADKGLRPGAP